MNWCPDFFWYIRYKQGQQIPNKLYLCALLFRTLPRNCYGTSSWSVADCFHSQTHEHGFQQTVENPAGFDVILVFFSPLLFKQWTCSHCELCSTSTFRDSPEFSSCMDTLSYCEPINSVVLALCSSAMICLQSWKSCCNRCTVHMNRKSLTIRAGLSSILSFFFVFKEITNLRYDWLISVIQKIMLSV